jgi:redox-sensitive bicupin YhaK (pirin superfamily)
MLDGHMLHQDSMGNQGDLRAGGVQWMKAASGVIHSETPQQSDGLMRGFQLWINLPAREKMSDPAYQEFSAESIPELEREEGRVRLLSGEYGGHRGPIQDPYTQVQYLDVILKPNQHIAHILAPDLTAFLYVFEGEAVVAGKPIPYQHLAVLGQGEQVEVAASAEGARFILVAGQPLREPIVQSGPFVMTTRQETEQAHVDYREGRLVRNKADVVGT